MSQKRLKKTAGQPDNLLLETNADLFSGLRKSNRGISSISHNLNSKPRVVFIQDNHEEVELQVHKIEIDYSEETALSLEVQCRTDFKNVLILAQKLKMKMQPFSESFSVTLQAKPEFLEKFSEHIISLKRIPQFFETLDEIKRPIFLNLDYYTIARISD